MAETEKSPNSYRNKKQGKKLWKEGYVKLIIDNGCENPVKANNLEVVLSILRICLPNFCL